MVKSSIKAPLITVCVPTYNHELYIAESLESILSQNINDIQIIVADDGSRDRTPSIVLAYKEKYPDIFDLIMHPKNKGIQKNVRSIYHLIKGKYVCWFSGDDSFLPGKLKKQLDFMEANPSYVMCYHDVWVQNRKNGLKYRFNNFLIGRASHSGNITKNLIRDRCFIAMPSTMIRREASKKISHRFDLGTSNDWLYAIELSMCGPVKFINEPLGIYYRHDRNISKTSISYKNEEIIYTFLDKEYGPLYKDSIQKGRATLYINYFFKYISLKRYEDASHLLNKIAMTHRKSLGLIFFSLSQIPIFFVKHFFLWFKTKSIHR
jgi:glycosyltransferase involved in cell wall biosynthesis